MNRRDFMGTIVASAAATQAATGREAATTDLPTSLPRARWLQNGLIDAGGTHETYLFMVRRGGQRLDVRQQYEHQESEALIRQLKEQGVEVFHTHLYKGFGIAAEKPGMEDTRRAAEIAHRYGMKVDTYIQWNTLMYETFFAEEPRAKDWVQRDIDGRPILLTYGFQQSFRYRPCFSRQEYRDYLKRIVRYAVEEVRTDFIHFDNFDLNPEPDSCHCSACTEGFRSYLKDKYSPARRCERFGFEDVDFINPPQWNRDNRPEKMEIIYDPAIQEWIDFRCHLMADALREVALYAKSLNPEVVIEINPHGITGANRSWENGIDHARLLKWTEAFWTEEPNLPRVTAEGVLVSKIRSYKLARAFDNVLLTYIESDPVAMAECLAFNQTLGYVGQGSLSPDMRRYVDFYRKNRDLFMRSRDVADVAVLRSYPSLTYHNASVQLSAILIEQALIQSRIPFHLIFDEPLPDLSSLKVLILPDSECLSSEHITKIRDFVEAGGGLIATGQAGLYDEWRRLRTEPGLKGLVEGQHRARAYEEEVGALKIPSGLPVRQEVGKGRVVYFPGILFDGPLPKMEAYFTISNEFWKRPANWRELIAEVRWAANAEMPVDIAGPEYLAANLVWQPEKRRTMFHLVNYDAKRAPSIANIDVVCRLPVGATAESVKLLRVGQNAADVLPFLRRGQEVSFSIPQMKTYAVAVVGWQRHL